jgi:RNA polymerase sigma-70 factor, ECF subfamily
VSAKAASFVEVYNAHARDVYRFALYLSGDRPVAQDITSETFLRVWMAEQPVRMCSVKAWLFVVARNLFLHELRRLRCREPLDMEMAAGSVEADAEVREECERVCRSLAELPEVDRSAVLAAGGRLGVRGDCRDVGCVGGGGESEGASRAAAPGEGKSGRYWP